MSKLLKMVLTNECTIEVSPEKPWFSDRSPDGEYRKCKEIVDQIERHCDDIGHTYISQKHVWETEDGRQWDRLYDTLEELFDEYGAQWKFKFRYVRPSDNGVGTRSSADNFESFIEQAWHNPWEFEYISGPALTEAQQKMLDKVLEASLNEKGGVPV